jgi:hypothetical protein
VNLKSNRKAEIKSEICIATKLEIQHSPSSPEGCSPVKRIASEWMTYRTRFLIKARQLDAPLTFVDAIGREHSGQRGDYLVESSDGSRRIAPREIFEDIYVPMGRATDPWPATAALGSPVSTARSQMQPPGLTNQVPGFRS